MMKRIYILLMLTLLGSGVFARAESVLYLKSSIEVSHKDVLLRDIVQDAAVLPAGWRDRHVVPAPPAGEMGYHSLTAIAYGLARYGDMKQITLRGESVISIIRRDRRVEKDEFYDPLLSYLNKTNPWKGNELDIKIRNLPRNLRVPSGKTTYRINQIDQKTSQGYSVAYIAVLVDGVEALEVPVGVDVQYLTEVWVAARSLERGRIISKEDLRSEMHVVDATSNYVPSSQDLVGHEVNRNLTPGSMVLRNVVSKPLCVKRGEWVSINALGEKLHITLRGKALANGRLGDRIMCMNERSHRQVLVELTGTGNGRLVRL